MFERARTVVVGQQNQQLDYCHLGFASSSAFFAAKQHAQGVFGGGGFVGGLWRFWRWRWRLLLVRWRETPRWGRRCGGGGR